MTQSVWTARVCPPSSVAECHSVMYAVALTKQLMGNVNGMQDMQPLFHLADCADGLSCAAVAVQE